MDRASEAGGGRCRALKVRFWVRPVGAVFIGECLEIGLVCEAATLEEAVDTLEEQFSAWAETADEIRVEGSRLYIRRVRLYWLKRIIFECFERLSKTRLFQPEDRAVLQERSVLVPAS